MKVSCNNTIAGIAAAAGGRIACGDPERRVVSITTDSRTADDGALFVPLAGERFDGHRFIEELAADGRIAGFLTMRTEYIAMAERYQCAAVLCDDTLSAYGAIAAAHRNAINPMVIGVTGTNGKTTSKELLASLLATAYTCYKSDKNYNNEIGVPFTLLNLLPIHRMAVIEMGMNHAGEIDRLSRIARPDIALITSIGEGHLEFLGSVENVARAKAEIMNGMRPGSTVFINGESACGEILRAHAAERGMMIKTFGLTGECDIRPERYRLAEDSIEIVVDGQRLTAPLYGIHNVYNALGAIAVAVECGVGTEAMQAGFNGYHEVGMRSQIIEAPGRGYVVINDAYNANPLSARAALQSASAVFGGRRLVAVLADMKELGVHAAGCHRALGAEVAGNGFARLYAYGDMASAIAEGAREAGMPDNDIRLFDAKPRLIESLLHDINAGDVVLVKGSRTMKMEEVADALVR